jgi:hypothetical protein
LARGWNFGEKQGKKTERGLVEETDLETADQSATRCGAIFATSLGEWLKINWPNSLDGRYCENCVSFKAVKLWNKRKASSAPYEELEKFVVCVSRVVEDRLARPVGG